MTSVSETISRMIEILPQEAQERLLDRFLPIISEISDEIEWDTVFEDTKDKLASIAKRVKKEVVQGKTEPMDYGRL
jgi:hypothetical protein